MTAAASPVPAQSPAPSPSGAPTTGATPQASPSPSLAPLVLIDRVPAGLPSSSPSPGQPKVLTHIYTSAYCSTFVEHFNNATAGIIGDDKHLDSVDTTIHQITLDWNRRDGAMRVYDDRVKLIGDVGAMLKQIPQTQAEVNALLAQANQTTDPDRKAALLDAASQLQKAVDRQRSMSYDLTSVIHVLEDKHTQEDTAETAIDEMMLPGYHEHGISLLDDPVPPAGVDSVDHPDPKVSPTPHAGDLDDVLQWGRQRWVIASSESQAAIAADKLVRICDGEVMASPPPSPKSH
ncbi:MAG TPA: hypothetical protein VEV38_13215 [Candidatus Eremiobacteraceae bacterium]|nr:hypothetical protein [Candidatus Eremiobacteraceae bacterium]